MKSTKAKDKINQINALFIIRAELKKLKAAEKELLSQIKAYVPEGGLDTGEHQVMIFEKTRRTLDKNLLLQEHGVKFVEKYMKETTYKEVKIT